MNEKPYTLRVTLRVEHCTQLNTPTSCLVTTDIGSDNTELREAEYQTLLKDTRLGLMEDGIFGVEKITLITSILLVTEPLIEESTNERYVYHLRFSTLYYNDCATFPKMGETEIELESPNPILTCSEFKNAQKLVQMKILGQNVCKVETPFLVSWIRTLKE